MESKGLNSDEPSPTGHPIYQENFPPSLGQEQSWFVLYADEIRQWSSVAISLIALGISAASFIESHNAAKLTRESFLADRAVVVIADPSADVAPQGTVFSLHAQSPSQHLSRVTLMFPSPLLKYIPDQMPNPWIETSGPNQQLSLDALGKGIAKVFRESTPLVKGASVRKTIALDVELQANYSVAGEMASRNGLYSLNTEITDDSFGNDAPVVRFTDISFKREIRKEESYPEDAAKDFTYWTSRTFYNPKAEKRFSSERRRTNSSSKGCDGCQ